MAFKVRENYILDKNHNKWSKVKYCNSYFDNETKLFYINKLINKKNRHPSYIKELVYLIRNNDKLRNKYAELLWEKGIFTDFFWRMLLINESTRNFWLNRICTLENFIGINPLLTKYIICNYEKEESVKSVIHEILIGESWKNLNLNLLWGILLHSEDKRELQTFADKLLKIVNCSKLYSDLVLLCIPLSSSPVKQKFINTLLSSSFRKIPTFILSECLDFVSANQKQEFVTKFFKEVAWEECSGHIVVKMITCLEKEEQQDIISSILKKRNYKERDPEILKFCLKTTSKSAQIIDFIEYVIALPILPTTFWLYFIVLDYYYLASDNLKENLKFKFRELIEKSPNSIADNLLSRYLKLTKDQDIAMCQLRYWIKNGYSFPIDYIQPGHNMTNDDLLLCCLMCFERIDPLPDEVELIIQYIINKFNYERNLSSSPHYLSLLKLNFYNSDSWKKETKNIIDNWKSYDRQVLYSVLGSHLYFPEKIVNLCKHIMLCWREELIKVTQQNRNITEYGEHLIIAMGHPSLKQLSKQTAIKILNSKECRLSEDFVELVDNITKKDKYPQWEPFDSDFFDLPIYHINPITFIIE